MKPLLITVYIIFSSVNSFSNSITELKYHDQVPIYRPILCGAAGGLSGWFIGFGIGTATDGKMSDRIDRAIVLSVIGEAIGLSSGVYFGNKEKYSQKMTVNNFYVIGTKS